MVNSNVDGLARCVSKCRMFDVESVSPARPWRHGRWCCTRILHASCDAILCVGSCALQPFEDTAGSVDPYREHEVFSFLRATKIEDTRARNHETEATVALF